MYYKAVIASQAHRTWDLYLSNKDAVTVAETFPDYHSFLVNWVAFESCRKFHDMAAAYHFRLSLHNKV